MWSEPAQPIYVRVLDRMGDFPEKRIFLAKTAPLCQGRPIMRRDKMGEKLAGERTTVFLQFDSNHVNKKSAASKTEKNNRFAEKIG